MLRVRELQLLNNRVISFDLATGESVVIQGANGSGKTLFMKSLTKLVPASYLEFTLNGVPAASIRPELLRSQLLYVPATPVLPSGTTVEDFFQSAFRLEVYKNHRPAFPFRDYVERWGLNVQDLSLLSTGQRQLLTLLRALALSPKVLLLDEPTANLDSSRTLEVEALLQNWQRDTGAGVILSSHSRPQAERLGFRVVPFK